MPRHGSGKRTREYAPNYSKRFPDAATDLNTRQHTYKDGDTYRQYYPDAEAYAGRTPVNQGNDDSVIPAKPKTKKKVRKVY